MDARHELIPVERFRHIIVGAVGEAFNLIIHADRCRQDQYGGPDPACAQAAQDLETRDVRQIEVEEYNVEIVKLSEINAFFPQVSGVHVEALPSEHALD